MKTVLGVLLFVGLLGFGGNGMCAFVGPHGVLPSEATCAAQTPKGGWEPRPENVPANNTVPTASQLSAFYAQPLDFNGPPNADFAGVTGNYTGTTQAILQWGACKWGMDPLMMQAEAWEESGWGQAQTGDMQTQQALCAAGSYNGWQPSGFCWTSFGIMQVKETNYNTAPMSQTSTAFNVDFRGAYWRACMNGDVGYYYNEVPVAGYPTYPNGTAQQMATGCLGSWYSGQWYDQGALGYIATYNTIKAAQAWKALPNSQTGQLAITKPQNGATVNGQVPISVSGSSDYTQNCYACLYIDGHDQGCTGQVNGTESWTWDSTASNHYVDGQHSVLVDTFDCNNNGPKIHAGMTLNTNN